MPFCLEDAFDDAPLAVVRFKDIVLARDTAVFNCSCIRMEKGHIFSWYRDINHSEGCRLFRRKHPQYVEPVKHKPTEDMMMSADTFDRLHAFEPVSAWRWRWRRPRHAWNYVLNPKI